MLSTQPTQSQVREIVSRLNDVLSIRPAESAKPPAAVVAHAFARPVVREIPPSFASHAMDHSTW